MIFKVKNLGVLTGNISIVVINEDDAWNLGAKPGDRVKIYHLNEKEKPIGNGIIATVDISREKEALMEGEIGFFEEVHQKFKLIDNDKEVEVQLASKPKSFDFIHEKVQGKELNREEIEAIIKDCTEGNLTPIEMAAFIVGLETRGATDEEVVYLTNSMAYSGDVLDFGNEVYDKHSTGGVPGNKITILIVPIIAAAGMFIPKTSTRAITSPSGTADSFEVLAQVGFSKEETIRILKENGSAILWGGALNSAPADNALINIEKPLHMDPFPLMIASIICKKMSMGVKKLVLDIPTGPGTKFPTTEAARRYAIRFKHISERVGIETICLITSASQPIGHAVGPALEAKEALEALIDPTSAPSSLINKSCELAGILLEMGGKCEIGKGKDLAYEYLKNGQAYEELKKIIKIQKGNPEIKPEDIEIGPFKIEMMAKKNGFVTEVYNKYINKIAKIAGCPASKKSGIVIHAKIGAHIKKGDTIFTIYSDSELRLKEAVEYYNVNNPQKLGGMTIEKI